jgi:hypothetical protein
MNFAQCTSLFIMFKNALQTLFFTNGQTATVVTALEVHVKATSFFQHADRCADNYSYLT